LCTALLKYRETELLPGHADQRLAPAVVLPLLPKHSGAWVGWLWELVG